MRRIPPLNGGLSVQWRPGTTAWAGLATRWAARQDRLSSGDLSDHRISPTGTPAWVTVDAFGAVPVGRRLRVTGGVRNLFDALYRVHGSGIDAPGITAWLALGIRP
jgi:hemoglobin/transferrin/lactoferrin receptor protein